LTKFVAAAALLVGVVWLYARSQGQTLEQVFQALTGQLGPAPPWTPDTNATNPTEPRPGFKEVCGQVVQVGGGIAVAVGDPITKAVGAGAMVGSPLVCAGAKGAVDVGKKFGKKIGGWFS
jgi:hypothetical protein